MSVCRKLYDELAVYSEIVIALLQFAVERFCSTIQIERFICQLEP